MWEEAASCPGPRNWCPEQARAELCVKVGRGGGQAARSPQAWLVRRHGQAHAQPAQDGEGDTVPGEQAGSKPVTALPEGEEGNLRTLHPSGTRKCRGSRHSQASVLPG
ncbi:uncharacterized protein LOC144576840 isoform X2 [Callithrix jacchus]